MDMLFYQLTLEHEEDIIENLSKGLYLEEKDAKNIISALNLKLEEISNKDFIIVCIKLEKHKLGFITTCIAKENFINSIIVHLQNILDKLLPGKLEFNIKEITAEKFVSSLESASDRYDRCLSLYDLRKKYGLDLDYVNDHKSFELRQSVMTDAYFSKEEAIEKAKALMLGDDMIDEIEKIYCDKHPQVFKGNPVHYKINCVDKDASYEIIELLAKALQSNNRVIGKRIDHIYNVIVRMEYYSVSLSMSDLENCLDNEAGAIVVLEISGYLADEGTFHFINDDFIDYLQELVKMHKKDTLFFFLEKRSNLDSSKKLMQCLKKVINVVEINEGLGEKRAAEEYLHKLLREMKVDEYISPEETANLLKEECYKASEIYRIAKNWAELCLSEKIYSAYAQIENIEKVEYKEKGSAINDLNALVGLNKIKELTKEIIAANVMDKKRWAFTQKDFQSSRHMIFTGNPGSAKTTVARLIARILKENNLLRSGYVVECGRGDLVGKYVGWTAKIVKEKFRDARGGVLFIDEAYSLVDGSNSFGAEAINTIVQEMENHRDDVIVIFAGYPEPMQEFMNSNEGLRSRIAFQLDFPDYDVDELMDILKFMLKKENFTLDEAGYQKAKNLFENATKFKDFGNGRLVRNVLERAIMRQSVRLFNQGNKFLSEKELFTLTADDIDSSLLALNYKDASGKKLGFCA